MAVEYSTKGRLYREIVNSKETFKRTWGNIVNLTEDQYLAYAAWDVIMTEVGNSTMNGDEQRTLMLTRALITLNEKTSFNEANELVESRIGQYIQEHTHIK